MDWLIITMIFGFLAVVFFGRALLAPLRRDKIYSAKFGIASMVSGGVLIGLAEERYTELLFSFCALFIILAVRRGLKKDSDIITVLYVVLATMCGVVGAANMFPNIF